MLLFLFFMFFWLLCGFMVHLLIGDDPAPRWVHWMWIVVAGFIGAMLLFGAGVSLALVFDPYSITL